MTDSARKCSDDAIIRYARAIAHASPIERVAGYDCIMPLYRLESHYLPDLERILHAARRSLAFA